MNALPGDILIGNAITPEIHNLLSLVLMLVFLVWSIRLCRQGARAYMLIYGRKNGSMHYVAGITPFMTTIRQLSRAHLTQFLRTQRSVKPVAVPRLSHPFSVTSPPAAAEAEDDCGDVLPFGVRFSFTTNVPCTIEAFWGARRSVVGHLLSSGARGIAKVAPPLDAGSGSGSGKRRRRKRNLSYEKLDEGLELPPLSQISSFVLPRSSYLAASDSSRFSAGPLEQQVVLRAPLELCSRATVDSDSPQPNSVNAESKASAPATARTHSRSRVPLLIVVSYDRDEGTSAVWDDDKELLYEVMVVKFPASAMSMASQSATPRTRAGSELSTDTLQDADGSDDAAGGGTSNDAPSTAVTVSKHLVVTQTACYSLKSLFGMDGEPECVVCLTNPKDVLLLPCRHVCVCQECFTHVDKCPVCRSQYTSVLTFNSPPLGSTDSGSEGGAAGAREGEGAGQGEAGDLVVTDNLGSDGEAEASQADGEFTNIHL